MKAARTQWKKNRLTLGLLDVFVVRRMPYSYTWYVNAEVPNAILRGKTTTITLEHGWERTQKAARRVALEAAEKVLERRPELKGGES